MRNYFLFLSVLFLLGCQTTQPTGKIQIGINKLKTDNKTITDLHTANKSAIAQIQVGATTATLSQEDIKTLVAQLKGTLK